MKRLLCIFLCMGLCLFGCNTKVIDPETFNKDNSMELPKAEKKRPEGIEEVFSEFSKICESNGFSHTPSQKEAKEVSKRIYISDKKTVYDEGEYYRYTSPNGEGISFGTEKTSVSYSSSYKDGQIINAASIHIGSRTKGFSFPFGIQIGDSRTEIFDMLGILDSFNNREYHTYYQRVYEDDKQYLYWQIDRMDPAIMAMYSSKIVEGGITYTKIIYMNFKDNKLIDINCYISSGQKQDKPIFDNLNQSKTVYPNQKYIKTKNMYIKINSVSIIDNKMLIKFYGYSEKRNSVSTIGSTMYLSDDVQGGSRSEVFFNFGRVQEYTFEVSLDSVLSYRRSSSIFEGTYYRIVVRIDGVDFSFDVSNGLASSFKTTFGYRY